MKRFLLIISAIILSSAAISAQTFATEKLYQKYRGEQGVVSIYIPGAAIRLASAIADLEREERQFLRSIRSLRILSIEDNVLFPDVNFVEELGNPKANNGYEVLIQVSDKGEDVMIFGREKHGKLKDLLVLVGGDDNVMVHIKGKMNSDMLASLADIAGVQQIELLGQL